MTTEFAGAIDLEPALTADEIAYVRRLAGSREAALAWAPNRDGTGLRPRRGADVAACVAGLRHLIATMDRPGRFRGMVAAYDTETGAMVAVTAVRGRVTTRVLRKRPAAAERSNVVDLAARRRAVSRAIS
ncbi:hypothetical protein [Nocardioides cynanchi]|uniref:hypothetical protein n=1 Tax=Nocardioides cynanchi TaxID=2558918 RepID=UPI001243EE87|nr:hypothetical protein [Nocardioides cynanchi]